MRQHHSGIGFHQRLLIRRPPSHRALCRAITTRLKSHAIHVILVIPHAKPYTPKCTAAHNSPLHAFAPFALRSITHVTISKVYGLRFKSLEGHFHKSAEAPGCLGEQYSTHPPFAHSQRLATGRLLPQPVELSQLPCHDLLCFCMLSVLLRFRPLLEPAEAELGSVNMSPNPKTKSQTSPFLISAYDNRKNEDEGSEPDV